MKEIQELGPRQLAWVESLEAHPERQCRDKLGKKLKGQNPIPYKACCLGEAEIVRKSREGMRSPFLANGDLKSGMSFMVLSSSSYEYYALYCRNGSIIGNKQLKGEVSLTEANDEGGASWIEIAAFIRENPSAVFSKSV